MFSAMFFLMMHIFVCIKLAPFFIFYYITRNIDMLDAVVALHRNLHGIINKSERIKHIYCCSPRIALRCAGYNQRGNSNMSALIVLAVCAVLACLLTVRAFAAPVLYVAPTGQVCGCMIKGNMHYNVATCSKVNMQELHEVIYVRSCD